jgi:RNA polymerase sigma factor (sigma-70 family)
VAIEKTSALLSHIRRLSRPAATLSDPQLLDRFTQAGDEAAFAELVRRHAQLVLDVCRRRLPREEDAEDAFQASFLVLARKAASIRKSESLASWLYGVAWRSAAQLRAAESERQRRERKIVPSLAEEPYDPSWREVRETLHQELARLPERYRAPLVLCYLEGRTQCEAARLLGWGEGVLRGRLDRGRERLRQRLVRRGVTLSGLLLAAVLVPAAPVSATLLRTTANLVSGSASAQVVAAANAVCRSLSLVPLKLGGLILLTAALVSAAGYRLAPISQAEDKKARPIVARPAVDSPRPNTRLQEDPLPPETLARLGTLRFRHGGFIHSIVFTPDGKQLLTHAHHEGLRIWDVATGREVLNLLDKGRELTISAALLTPDGKSIVTLDSEFDGQQYKSYIRLRDLNDSRVLHEFATEGLNHSCLSPDGKLLAGVSGNQSVEIWDLALGQRLSTWKASDDMMWCAAFTADGKTFITGSGKLIRFWDTATGQKKREIASHPNVVRKLSVSGDGILLATLGMTEVKFDAHSSSYNCDHFIRIWDTATGKELRQLAIPTKKGSKDSLEGISTLAFSPDGKTLASAGQDGVARLWDPATGKELRSMPMGMRSGGGDLAFSTDGKTLAVGMNAIHLFDVASGKDLLASTGHGGAVYASALAPDGRTIATASQDGTIIAWDAVTGRQQRLLGQEGTWPPLSRGHTLLSVGPERMLRVWDLTSGRDVHTIGLPKDFDHLLALSADQKKLAVAVTDRAIAILDVATGKEITRLKGQQEWIMGAAFGPDGRTLIVWRRDHTAQIWDVSAGRELRHFPIAGTKASPLGMSDPGYTAAVSSDGRLIAYGHGFNGPAWGYVALQEVATGKVVRRLDHLSIPTSIIAFSPDDRMVAFAGRGEQAIHLLEVATGEESHVLHGHKGGITSLTFSADGRTLVSGSADTTALVWDLAGGQGGKPGTVHPADLDACWANLAGSDAVRAFDAIRGLCARPEEAVQFLRRHLPSAADPGATRLAELITDLDSSAFAKRDAAMRELTELAELAAPALRDALHKAPALEARRRIEQLLTKVDSPVMTGVSVRAVRAIEVLERINTPDARQTLEALAKGAPRAIRTEEARAALDRLKQRAR